MASKRAASISVLDQPSTRTMDEEEEESCERVIKVMQEGDIVALEVMHCPAHAGEALTEAQVIGSVVLRRLAFAPIPVAAVLKVDDEGRGIVDDSSFGLEAEIVHATNGLFEDLRPHDRGTDGHDHAVVESFEGGAEELEIDFGGASKHRAVEHRVVRNDVVAYPRMNGERNILTECVGEHAGVAPPVQYDHWAGRDHVLAHGAEEIGTSGGERMRGLFAHRFFQFLRFRKNRAILIDEAAERPTEAFAVDAADEQGEMDVAPSFVPGAEGAGGDVVTNAFGGAAEEGEF